MTSNRINGIVQDKSGFLWIATNNGLNRFDGVENKQYIKQVDDSCSLSTNTVLTQYCDSKGQLWFLTVNYLHRYNRKLDNFDHFLLSIKKESARYGNKGVITEDRSGNIWVGTPTNGLFFFNRATNQCEKIRQPNNSVSSLFFDQDGLLWIGGIGQLTEYNPLTKEFKQFKVPDALHRNLNDDYVWNIWPGNSKRINLLLSSGLFQFDQKKELFSELSDWNRKVNFTSNVLRTILVMPNEMWIGTQGGGLYILNLSTDKVAQYQSIYNNPGSLSNNSITSIIKDNCGIYWIGTNDGINKFDPATLLFAHYQKDPGNTNSLQYNFVSSFCESPDGNIWIGTFGQGISVYNREKETFQTITSSPGNRSSLINNTIRALEPDNFGNIWIGTTNGLSCYNAKQKIFTNYNSSAEKGSISSDDILSLLVTRDNRLFVGSNAQGLSFCRIDHLAEDGFQIFNSHDEFLNQAKVRKMIELHNETIVCGTMGNGICILTGAHATNILPSEFSKSIDSDYVNALCEDSEHNIWIGTWDGLFLMDPDYKFIKQFNPKNGLPSNEISGLLVDSKGDIWAAGMNGLSQLSKISGHDYKITNYTTHNGLQGSYFTTYSTLKTTDGELFFGGFNGFNRFYPGQIKSDPKIPKVVLTDFQVFNQSVPIGMKVNGQILLTENISDTKSIVLNNAQKVIGFRFSALTTTQIQKVKFACIMKGIDPDWVYLEYNQRYKAYNNLPPGEYTFTVKACNADGVWDNEGTSVAIKVLPPFWKSWWAYALYVLIIVGFLYLAREYSLSRARLQNNALLERVRREKDAEINNLKIKFFINISHEIRTPLSLILAPLEKLVRSAEPSPEIKRNLETMHGNALRLFNLINQLLDFRKIETGNVHLNVAPYDVVAVIQEIKKAFDESAVLKNIKLSVETNVQTLQIWFDPDSIEKIMFNLLSNALKFTPSGGKVQILIHQTDGSDQCEIIVRDNGIGVASDKLEKLFDRFYQVDSKSFLKHDNIGSGIGLSIVKNLVELHKGEITVESKPGEFTLFRMLFKTGKSHLENIDNITLSEDPIPYTMNIHAPVPQIESLESTELQKAQESKNKIRILIVEDNPEIRYYLKQSLHSGYEVIEASNGKSGYKMALQQIPDLVITDVMMPEMDGIELCKVLKNELLTQHIPIIILSAKSTIEDTLEGLETGADDYVPKPFNEQILLAKIKTLLSNRQRLIEKFQRLPMEPSAGDEEKKLRFDDPFVDRLVDYIHANLKEEELTNEKIELYFKTNKMQLYRKLKAVTGWSVNTLIREIKIREATRLLKNSEMNISEIAYHLSFSDPLYFSKYFKKEVGVAPQQYRKEN
ncbi:MAG TPA: two-component regulator propeller domain-containing protein [Prolixibacteraceae bacterium]|nr:two-component regulator propeller domain-containing protein [Prolixibacteraceae bacterium]